MDIFTVVNGIENAFSDSPRIDAFGYFSRWPNAFRKKQNVCCQATARLEHSIDFSNRAIDVRETMNGIGNIRSIEKIALESKSGGVGVFESD